MYRTELRYGAQGARASPFSDGRNAGVLTDFRSRRGASIFRTMKAMPSYIYRELYVVEGSCPSFQTEVSRLLCMYLLLV